MQHQASAAVAVAGQKRFAWMVTAELPGTIGTAAAAGPSDATSRIWLRRLNCAGADREAAVTELHALLLRAARFEIGRRRLAFPQLGGADLDDLAWPSADDALMSVLRRLGDFRGDRRFTTWAHEVRHCGSRRQGPQARVARARNPPARGVVAVVAVLAERLNTTRSALYTTLRDARRKLRAALAERGMDTMGRVP
jgi:RNA polymerase sigma-70 factor, ECF subfamily